MERIIVIGSPGSGKTTLSLELSKKLRLSLVHLDMLKWRDGWQSVSKEEFDRLLQAELVKPQWIIDGNYGRTIPIRLQHCDTVIWLDYPRITCILGVLKRVITYRGKSRPDMGGYCPERIDFKFLRYVWRFNKQNRSHYQNMLDEFGNVRVITLRSRKETERFLEEL